MNDDFERMNRVPPVRPVAVGADDEEDWEAVSVLTSSTSTNTGRENVHLGT